MPSIIYVKINGVAKQTGIKDYISVSQFNRTSKVQYKIISTLNNAQTVEMGFILNESGTTESKYVLYTPDNKKSFLTYYGELKDLDLTSTKNILKGTFSTTTLKNTTIEYPFPPDTSIVVSEGRFEIKLAE